MNVKILWVVIIVLALIVLAEAGYIYKQRADAKNTSALTEIDEKGYSEKALDEQWKELDEWHKKVRRRMSAGSPLLDPDFDSFFGDSFFGRKYNPFTEMGRIHRQMLDTLRGSERTVFDDAWDKWYGRRMLMGEFKTDVVRTDKEVTVIISLPGLTSRTADIDITDERIKISFSAKTSTEEKSAGRVMKKESSENYVKILPVPGDAVPGTGKAEMEGERVKIRFDRKKAK